VRSFRITKYDPRHRAASGAYQRDEWTAFSDVGRTFAGEVLTLAEYLRVEDLYLDAVQCSMRCAGVESVTVAALEMHRRPDTTIFTGMQLDAAAARAVARSVLREQLWCKLVGPDGYYIHFGYDYYLYTGGTFHRDLAAEIRGLYIEVFDSPYRD
jgi:hypothetical protein